MIIARNPLYQPGDDLSPRMRTAFSEAKKRLLPSIVQQQYADAKGAFDRKEFESAASGFRRVMDALNDPDMGSAASKPPLADLRTLAAGFHDLSVKAMPPAPTPTPAPVPQPVAAAPTAAAAVARPVSLIYTGEERNVVPPQTLAQTLPKYPGAVPPRGVTGVVEVVIDEGGTVESAAMVVPVTASYDKMVMSAATKWVYIPAMMNGKPVKFRKRIQITVTPPAP
jgi:TonB family protein